MSHLPPSSTSNVIPFPIRVKPCLSTRAAVFDPQAVARAFPGLWQDWVKGSFGSVEAAARAFGVCPRAAGKWFEGEGACHGSRLIMAEMVDPGLSARIAADLLRRAA